MYLRFVILNKDRNSHQAQGIFQAGWRLLESGELTDAEAADLQDLLEWFNQHMPAPEGSARRALSDRAVFWFRPTAPEFLKQARQLSQLLRLHGLFVDVLKTHNPGTVVYADECQIAAVRKKHFR